MEWLEISVAVAAEAAEAVAEVLSRYTPQGVAIDLGAKPEHKTVTVRAYINNETEERETLRQKIEEALWHLSQIWPLPDPSYAVIADQDWTARWKETIPILHLGKRLVIKPSWRNYKPAADEVVLEMDPGMAFGTGLHPTTQLCVEALEDSIQPGTDVLDLGTGTGILAMAASKMGASKIMAVDNDPSAVVVALRNAKNNALDQSIQVVHGSLSEAAGTYDLILANILAPIIISMAQEGLATRLKPGGRLITSGILDEQKADVVAALESTGLTIVEVRKQEDWVAIIAESHIAAP